MKNIFHILSLGGNYQLVEWMCEEKNVDVNKVEFYGKTPLHHVVENFNIESHDSYIETIKCLINNGADWTKIDDFKRSPVDYADELGCDDLCLLFENAIKNNRKKC